MKNNKALIPFIIATIIALGIIVTTTYDPSAHPAVSQVATTEISTAVSSTITPVQKQTNYSSTSSSHKNNYSNPSQSDNDYGYGDPLPGESLPDYIKREDPDLYNDMKDRYDTGTQKSDYGYGAPKKGESFVDYMKREDPDLYNSMKNDYESMFGDW